MRLHEFDIVGLISGETKKEKQERQELTKKSIGMFKKAMADFERIQQENADTFKDNPTEAFEQWFEYYFDRAVARIVDHPGLYNSVKNPTKIMNFAPALIMYASMDYYLKAKTPQQGSEEIVVIAPQLTRDKKLVSIVQKLFGKYVVTGKNQKQLDTDKKPKLGITYTVKNGDEYKWLGAQWGNVTTGRVATKEVAAQLTQIAIDKGDVE